MTEAEERELTASATRAGKVPPPFGSNFRGWQECQTYCPSEHPVSPRKLHPLLERADTKKGSGKKYSFWTFPAHMNQTSQKK